MARLKRVREESVNDLGTLLMIKENQGQKAYDMEENENVLRGGAWYLYIHISTHTCSFEGFLSLYTKVVSVKKSRPWVGLFCLIFAV